MADTWSPSARPEFTTYSPVRASRSPTAIVTFCSLSPFTRKALDFSPSRTSAVAGSVMLLRVAVSRRPSA